MAVPVARNVARRDDNHIDGSARPVQVIVNPPRQGTAPRPLLHDQQINVTAGTHTAPGGRTEQNDLLRLRHLDNPPNDIVENALVRYMSCHRSALLVNPVANAQIAAKNFAPALVYKKDRIPNRFQRTGQIRALSGAVRKYTTARTSPPPPEPSPRPRRLGAAPERHYSTFMPAQGAITYVETHDAARRIEHAVQSVRTLGLDCEAAGLHRYSDRLCLVQLSVLSETFVLDPLALDLKPYLKPLLEDPQRRIVLHGGDFDLRLLARDLDVAVANPADTQIAASLLGEPALGLQDLLAQRLNIRVSKKFQKADWARRPLPRKMIHYAAGDTRHLHRLIAILEKELSKRGRLHWAQEEYRRLAASAANAHEDAAEPDPVTRFKEAQRMDNRSVAALREIIAWRDRIARAWDRAPGRIVNNAALVEVVAMRPASIEALAAIRGFPARLAETRGPSLLDILDQVARLPDSALSPYPPAPRATRPTEDEEAAFDRLKKARNRAAERLKLDRGIVMPNHALQNIAAAAPRNLAALAAIPGVRQWQAETIGEALLAALRQTPATPSPPNSQP